MLSIDWSERRLKPSCSSNKYETTKIWKISPDSKIKGNTGIRCQLGSIISKSLVRKGEETSVTKDPVLKESRWSTSWCLRIEGSFRKGSESLERLKVPLSEGRRRHTVLHTQPEIVCEWTKDTVNISYVWQVLSNYIPMIHFSVESRSLYYKYSNL